VTVMENRIIVAPSGTGWQGTSTTFNIQHSTFLAWAIGGTVPKFDV
jgi:hypothetical protein